MDSFPNQSVLVKYKRSIKSIIYSIDTILLYSIYQCVSISLLYIIILLGCV